MTAAQVIEVMREQGISIARDGQQLRVKSSRGKITAEHQALILQHKQAILSCLEACDSPAPVPSSGPGVIPLPLPATRPYKEYLYPEGEHLQLTKEEFDNVVDVFKMLLRQDQRNQAARKSA